MLTQLRLSGRLASRVGDRLRPVAALRRARRRASRRATVVAELLRGFPGPGAVRVSVGPHDRRRSSACRSACATRVVGARHAGARPRRSGRAHDRPWRDSLHRHLRHGDGHAGGDAQGARPRRAGIRPRRVSADERLPRARGHPRVRRLSRRAHHAGHRPRRRRQRDLARQSGARGSARSQDPLSLAARSHSRRVPLAVARRS